MGKAVDKIRKKNGKIRLHAVTLESDIRYRGPLSYREFKIIGWFCIILTQVIVMMKLGGKVNASIEERLAGWRNVLAWFADLALPFLLMSNFAIILDNRKSYKDQLISNGIMMLSVFLVYVLVFYHFVLGSLSALGDGTMRFMEVARRFYYSSSKYGFFCFNIFVDLFLCTLVMFFINYRPSRFFQGRKLIIFRLFAILPFAYEVASLTLKWLSGGGIIRIPFILFPLLTVKPPMTFLVFIILTLFVKHRERKFIKQGGSYEQYQEFLQTNRNSFSFSVFATIVLFVAGIVDLILLIMIPSFQMVQLQNIVAQSVMADPAMTEAAAAEVVSSMSTMDIMTSFIDRVFAVGVGGSAQLIIFAPLMLLFSYTRKRSFTIVDPLIPVIAFVLLILMYLQSFYQIMHVLPFSGKVNFQEVFDMIDKAADMLPELITMME